jgi:hypothetical protein
MYIIKFTFWWGDIREVSGMELSLAESIGEYRSCNRGESRGKGKLMMYIIMYVNDVM